MEGMVQVNVYMVLHALEVYESLWKKRYVVYGRPVLHTA